ncbi:hypothetical protein [Thiobacillus denitrificans]|uniref:hypothetical protein n=1 Tax=Thiobacillus denitrificans TaxID=36861 RepID=UPI00036D1C03|nr:hypothetical protein [Thiobacillus denitrificans]
MQPKRIFDTYLSDSWMSSIWCALQLFLLSGVAVFALLALPNTVRAENDSVVVIANRAAAVSHLDAAELRTIFSLRRKYWSNGVRIQAVIVTSSTDNIHALFCREDLEVFPYMLDRMWLRQISSGEASNGITKSSEKEAIDFIAKTPGAIGYARAGTPLPNNVTVVEAAP